MLGRLLSISIFTGSICIACKTPQNLGGDESAALIVGGQLESGHPEVKLVVTDKDRGGICSGVAVSDNTMLIGAHCLTRKAVETKDIRSPDTNALVQEIVLWANVVEREFLSPQDASRDLAVLIFPPKSLKGPFAKVANTLALKETAVDLVGYGVTSFSGVPRSKDSFKAEKNRGHNLLKDTRYCAPRTSKCQSGVLILEAKNVGVMNDGGPELSAALAGPGDSGSPLYLSSSQTVIGIAAGVAGYDSKGRPTGVRMVPGHGYQIETEGAQLFRNIYVDLTSETSRTLMGMAVTRGAQIDNVRKVQPSALSHDDQSWMELPRGNFRGQGEFKSIFLLAFVFKNMICKSGILKISVNGKDFCTSGTPAPKGPIPEAPASSGTGAVVPPTPSAGAAPTDQKGGGDPASTSTPPGAQTPSPSGAQGAGVPGSSPTPGADPNKP